MRRLLVLVCICVLVPATVAAATTVSGKFHGSTSQGKSFLFKISNGTLRSAAVQWSATCTSTGTTLSGKTVFNGSLYRGRYNQREVYTVKVGNGLKAKHTATVQLAVRSHRMTGTFRLNAVVRNAQNVITTTCSSSKVTFSARAVNS
jgi:hypothetical protein